MGVFLPESGFMPINERSDDVASETLLLPFHTCKVTVVI
jgi:hypothetical protein